MEIIDYQAVELPHFDDNRGRFIEWYRESVFSSALTDFHPLQVNVSTSRIGVIRGLHFSLKPNQTMKFVTCLSGQIRDVGLDLRPNSPTFGRWNFYDLDSQKPTSIFVGAGIAHGFEVLSDQAIVSYLVSSEYSPQLERSINPLDSDLGIPWKGQKFELSDKDRKAHSFKDFCQSGELQFC